MAISVGGAGAEERPMSDINTTPLVDVMLVLLIIFLIAVPVAIQQIQKLKIPIMVSVESKDKVENLLLTVSTTDAGGRSAEAMMASPEKIPQVHIRADVEAPWRCVAGAIYNVQISGYPTVGFISTPVDPNG